MTNGNTPRRPGGLRLVEPTEPPMCPHCGHFFRDDPAVGRAYLFLYHSPAATVTINMDDFGVALERAILDPDQASPALDALAVAHALAFVGFPLSGDLMAAVLHRDGHPNPEDE